MAGTPSLEFTPPAPAVTLPHLQKPLGQPVPLATEDNNPEPLPETTPTNPELNGMMDNRYTRSGRRSNQEPWMILLNYP